MIERKPIRLTRVALEDELYKTDSLVIENLKLINVRGCNGSGKSTIPLQMLANDRGAFIYTLEGKDVATCFPSFNYVAMGTYRTKTGGLDRFSGNAETKKVLEYLLQLKHNILMEGVISSTIFSTFRDWFLEIETIYKRKVGIMNLLPPLETCLERVQSRNGGKEVKTDQIASKWRTVRKNVDKFAEAGLNSWISDNSGIDLTETLSWFFHEVTLHMEVSNK